MGFQFYLRSLGLAALFCGQSFSHVLEASEGILCKTLLSQIAHELPEISGLDREVLLEWSSSDPSKMARFFYSWEELIEAADFSEDFEETLEKAAELLEGKVFLTKNGSKVRWMSVPVFTVAAVYFFFISSSTFFDDAVVAVLLGAGGGLFFGGTKVNRPGMKEIIQEMERPKTFGEKIAENVEMIEALKVVREMKHYFMGSPPEESLQRNFHFLGRVLSLRLSFEESKYHLRIGAQAD